MVSLPTFIITKQIKGKTMLQTCSEYGSIKCFKSLLRNGCPLNKELCKSSIIGGNTEIINILESVDFSFKNCLKIAIKYHRNDIFDWLLKQDECEMISPEECLKYYNIGAFQFIIKNDPKQNICLANTELMKFRQQSKPTKLFLLPKGNDHNEKSIDHDENETSSFKMGLPTLSNKDISEKHQKLNYQQAGDLGSDEGKLHTIDPYPPTVCHPNEIESNYKSTFDYSDQNSETDKNIISESGELCMGDNSDNQENYSPNGSDGNLSNNSISSDNDLDALRSEQLTDINENTSKVNRTTPNADVKDSVLRILRESQKTREMVTFNDNQQAIDCILAQLPRKKVDNTSLPLSYDVIFLWLAYTEHPKIKYLAKKIEQKTSTLKKWRVKLKKDPNWRPSKTNMRKSHRAICSDFEEEIVKHINKKFLSVGEPLNDKIFTEEMMKFSKEKNAVENGFISEKFKCSRKFVRNFRQRHNYVIKKKHIKRRGSVDDRIVDAFTKYMKSLLNDPTRIIVNVDETFWGFSQMYEKAWCEKGKDDTPYKTDCDPKQGYTAIAAITVNGEKRIPLYIIEKTQSVKPQETEKRREGDFPYFLDHTKSGWSTHESFIRYMEFLIKELNPGDKPIYLLLDMHPSHRHKAVKDFAIQKNIKLRYIPPGCTDILQPLDIKIFGILKKKARVKFNAPNEKNENIKQRATYILVSTWEEIAKDNIKQAWKKFRDDFIQTRSLSEEEANEEEEEEASEEEEANLEEVYQTDKDDESYNDFINFMTQIRSETQKRRKGKTLTKAEAELRRDGNYQNTDDSDDE